MNHELIAYLDAIRESAKQIEDPAQTDVEVLAVVEKIRGLSGKLDLPHGDERGDKRTEEVDQEPHVWQETEDTDAWG